MKIGPHLLENNVIAAPMAGVTDAPFRRLCRRLGAGLAVSEMMSSSPLLRDTRTSRLRRCHDGEPEPRAVQIAGADPRQLADTARLNVDEGAQLIDINMGCPAKKVCRVAAGSALLADEALVVRILHEVVNAVPVPVTLKIRTGPAPERRNAVRIARLAEDAGVAAITVHGRTRACAFTGPVEYHSIAAVKRAVSIPVIANGDIMTARQAARVLELTSADGVMVGRAAQGNPWIFREITHYLRTGTQCPAPSTAQVRATLLEHLDALYDFYGERAGVRIARKHLGWYCRARFGGEAFWSRVNRVEQAHEQRALADEFLLSIPGAEAPSCKQPMERAA
ncbi:MAG: tRNA-dihydrouridine synthase B [Gammaproteobacteria bacterium]|jgi:tRNA-dihydrouridine synthase B